MNTHTVNEAAAAVLSAGLRAALEADALGRECVRVWCVRACVRSGTGSCGEPPLHTVYRIVQLVCSDPEGQRLWGFVG